MVQAVPAGSAASAGEIWRELAVTIVGGALTTEAAASLQRSDTVGLWKPAPETVRVAGAEPTATVEGETPLRLGGAATSGVHAPARTPTAPSGLTTTTS